MLWRLYDSCKFEGEEDIISRKEWKAEPPVLKVRFKAATRYVLLVYRSGPYTCHGKEDCMITLRQIQKSNFVQELDDIQYNFMVGGNGQVFEGRGWETSCPVPRKYNAMAFCFSVAFIGDYSRKNPSYGMMLSAMKVVDTAIDKGVVRENFDVLTFRIDA